MTERLSRRGFLSTAGAGVFAAGQARPNLLLILTDQQHIDAIAAAGCRWLHTPAMDYLHQHGTSFAQSHCVDPVCSPSRSALFTGRMPNETGVPGNGRPVRSDIPNLGQWFSENSDYETVYAGKWHLPGTYTESIPGFRVLPGGIGGQGNLGDTCVSRACEAYLRNRAASRPFLLVASFLQPHDICEWLRLNMAGAGRLRYPELAAELPPLPPNFEVDPREPRFLQRTRAGNEPAKGNWGREHWRYYLWSYYRHVEMVDGEVGRILHALRNTGRDKDTLIAFTADHGEGMAHHQMVRKSSSYDEALKVPLLMSWPGNLPEGRRDTRSLASGLDIVPTLCDFAGIRPPSHMRGRSLRPVLEGKTAGVSGFLVCEIPTNAGRVARTARYKYVTYAGDPVEQLFDIEADPG